jgi:phage baseplate assembly protein W
MSTEFTLGSTVTVENGDFLFVNGEPSFLHGAEGVVQHVRRCLTTFKGTDFVRPDFGVDFISLTTALRYATNDEARQQYIEVFVVRALFEADERIANVEVTDVRIVGSEAEVFLELRIIDGSVANTSSTLVGVV